MEIFDIVLGLVMIYSVVHFFIVGNTRIWNDRSSYEKFITIVGMVSIFVVFLGIMAE